MLTVTRDWHVEWGDCDAAGIVFYPRFLAAFDTSTGRLLEAASGMGMAELIRTNGIVGWPMVDLSVQFLAPVSYGEVVEIRSRVEKVGRSSFTIAHRLCKRDATHVQATEVRVWAGPQADGTEGIAAAPIPAQLVARLKGA